MNTTPKVTWGPGSIIGFLAAAAAAIAPIVGELADAAKPLGVPPSVWVVVSSALAAATVLGRMWQAASAARAPQLLEPQLMTLETAEPPRSAP